jgi:hypothetical protein
MYEFKHTKHKKQSVEPTLTPDQQFLWEERVAICIVDGRLTIEQAEKIAWQQVACNSKK